MPQPKKGYSLGSGPSHQQLMLRNLARSLFEHEKVKTTEAKAKALRPFAEKLITKARKGTIHHRRQALALIEDREVVHKLFADIGPRFATRNGGYTRILKLGRRDGDGAAVALIELVEGEAAASRGEAATETRRRRLRRPGRRRAPATPEPEAPGEATQEEAALAEAEATPEGATEQPGAQEPEADTSGGESAGESSPR